MCFFRNVLTSVFTFIAFKGIKILLGGEITLISVQATNLYDLT